MKKIVFIGGPTASGKTNLAISIAKKFNGELINADSRQIYKYLDIGTNKGPIVYKNGQNFIEDVPIHLIGFLNPNQRYSVYDFKLAALQKIEDIISKGKLPIIVGGTGLYIDSIIKNYPLTQNTNQSLRIKLESKDLDQLQKMLKDKYLQEFERLNQSDKNNKRRLVRLIEKLQTSLDANIAKPLNYEYLFLYPEYDLQGLIIKIDLRVEQMFKEGIVDETKAVLQMGFPKNSVALQGVGYKEVLSLLDGAISLSECINLVKISHRQYAKRQRTWFEGKGRNYKLTITKGAEDAINKVEKFYEQRNTD